MSETKICPRCGKEYNYIEKRVVGSNIYLLAVHRSAKGVKKCYLGPEKLYKYVEKLYKLDAISGLNAVDYVEIAIRSLEKLRDIVSKNRDLVKDQKTKILEKLSILEYSISELKQILHQAKVEPPSHSLGFFTKKLQQVAKNIENNR